MPHFGGLFLSCIEADKSSFCSIFQNDIRSPVRAKAPEPYPPPDAAPALPESVHAESDWAEVRPAAGSSGISLANLANLHFFAKKRKRLTQRRLTRLNDLYVANI